MVTLRRSLISGLMLVVVLCALAGSAVAGPVQVFGNWARGDMGTAHNAGTSQYIGCWVNTDTVGPPLLYCEANDGLGSVNFCYTTNANMLNTMQTVQLSSDIEFGWDGSHGCTWITISNFSQPPGRKS
jgi:hypothetical protein